MMEGKFQAVLGPEVPPSSSSPQPSSMAPSGGAPVLHGQRPALARQTPVDDYNKSQSVSPIVPQRNVNVKSTPPNSNTNSNLSLNSSRKNSSKKTPTSSPKSSKSSKLSLNASSITSFFTGSKSRSRSKSPSQPHFHANGSANTATSSTSSSASGSPSTGKSRPNGRLSISEKIKAKTVGRKKSNATEVGTSTNDLDPYANLPPTLPIASSDLSYNPVNPKSPTDEGITLHLKKNHSNIF